MSIQVGRFNGLLVLDKPSGKTSRDVVNHAQSWFPHSTRLGHTGTLDPLATGVLVLCIGTATRLAEFVQQMEKGYRAGILLGVRSDTDDVNGSLTPAVIERPPDLAEMKRLLGAFVGKIDQVPPDYSAAWITGKLSPVP